jgi:hypothetical protein
MVTKVLLVYLVMAAAISAVTIQEDRIQKGFIQQGKNREIGSKKILLVIAAPLAAAIVSIFVSSLAVWNRGRISYGGLEYCNPLLHRSNCYCGYISRWFI